MEALWMRSQQRSRAPKESGRGHRAFSSWQLLLESNPAYPGFGEEYTAAPAWIEPARLLKESFRFEGRGPDSGRLEQERFSKRD
jgi:hypothetical protein